MTAIDSSPAHRASSRQLYIDLSADDAVVLDIKRKGSGVEVMGVANFARPESVDPAHASNVGSWIRSELSSRSIGIHPVSFACRRHDAILKRIDLSGAGGKKESQLAPMMMLQMSRHLPFPMVGSSLDYVPMDSQVDSSATVARMMGAVLPAERLRFLTETASSVFEKGGPESIGLHAAGAWALLCERSRSIDGALMGIAIGVASSSIVVLEAGRMMFVRGVDVGMDRELNAVDPGALALEAKRTWMGYRAIPDAKEISHVCVLGEDAIVSPVVASVSTSLQLPVEIVRAPAAVRFAEGLTLGQRTVALPVAGLAIESELGVRSFDFVHPRRAPDVAQVRRQRALLGALGMVVMAGGLGVYLSVQLDDLRERVAAAEKQKTSIEEKFTRAVLDDARLSHIERWRESHIDWLAHMERIASGVPSAPDALLDQWRGTMRAIAVFTPKDRKYFGGTWSSQKQADFFIAGPIKSASVITSIREQLLGFHVYGVRSNGPDGDTKFSFDLTSAQESPIPAVEGDDATLKQTHEMAQPAVASAGEHDPKDPAHPQQTAAEGAEAQ